jgi:hypothetical protein
MATSTLPLRDMNEGQYAAPRDRVAEIIAHSSSGGTSNNNAFDKKTGGGAAGGGALSRGGGGSGGSVFARALNAATSGIDPLAEFVAGGKKLGDGGGAGMADALVAQLQPLLGAIYDFARAAAAAADPAAAAADDDDADDDDGNDNDYDAPSAAAAAAAAAAAGGGGGGGGGGAVLGDPASAVADAALKRTDDDRIRFSARMTLERVKQERYAETGENARHELYADVPHWLGRLSEELSALHGDERRRYHSEVGLCTLESS